MIFWVYTVGYILFVGLDVTYMSGFCPPYCMIYCCFYFIFACWANIFLIALLYTIYCIVELFIVLRAYYNSTYRAKMSSADSLMSAVFSVASSFPLVVVEGLVVP